MCATAANLKILRRELKTLAKDRAILFRYPTPGLQFAFGRRKEEEKGHKKKLDLLRQNWKKAPRGRGGISFVVIRILVASSKERAKWKEEEAFFPSFFSQRKGKGGMHFSSSNKLEI